MIYFEVINHKPQGTLTLNNMKNDCFPVLVHALVWMFFTCWKQKSSYSLTSHGPLHALLWMMFFSCSCWKQNSSYSLQVMVAAVQHPTCQMTIPTSIYFLFRTSIYKSHCAFYNTFHSQMIDSLLTLRGLIECVNLSFSQLNRAKPDMEQRHTGNKESFLCWQVGSCKESQSSCCLFIQSQLWKACKLQKQHCGLKIHNTVHTVHTQMNWKLSICSVVYTNEKVLSVNLA